MSYTSPKTWAVGDPMTAGDLNTYVRDQFLYLAGTGGSMVPAASDHKFGFGAAGGTGADVHLIGDGTTAYVVADGSPTNIPLLVRPKGTGGIKMQDAATGDALTLQTPISALTSGQTAMLLLAYHNGTAVVSKQVTLGAADSGGTGFKLLRVPNT